MAGATAAMAMPVDLIAGSEKHRYPTNELLPLRKLGKTGKSVTMLGVGGFHIHWTSEKEAREVIDTALENGVNFFDTAENYGPNVSEIRYGRFLTPKYRDQIFLMTKSQAKDAKTAREHLEGSLRRMKTDYLDLWQVHSLFTPEDVDERFANGVIDVFQEAKESGKVRFIGFTGHQNPYAHLRMLERTADRNFWDAAQMPVNPLDAASDHSFTNLVMPKLLERNIGILAMKTLADGRFFAKKNHYDIRTDTPIIPDRFSVTDAMNFAWSLPISTLITGAENTEFLAEKIRLAKQFTQLDEAGRDELIDRVSDLERYGKFEYYKKA